jgi:predicted metal-binding membrane protein
MRRSRALVYGATAVAVLLGWAYLVAVVLAVPDVARGNLGPGMNLTALGSGPSIPTFLLALCAPTTLATGIDTATAAVTFAMWVAMVFAMMLPSAVPMFTTYSDIAAEAARKQMRVPSVLVLAGGYVSVWVAFAVAATVAQLGLVWLGTLSPAMTPLAPALAGTTLIGAGAYQFTSAKYACLVRCRAPFSILFTRWRTSAHGMYRLGLEEGLFCLGCCWALMVVMFAVGVMNVVWMAVLTVLMVAEKATSGRGLTWGIGTGLMVWGVLLLAVSQPGRRLMGLA